MASALLVVEAHELRSMIRDEFRSCLLERMPPKPAPAPVCTSKPEALEPSYTTAQVAEFIHCDESTVAGYIRAKKLRATKVARRWIILKSDLEAYMREHEAAPLKAPTRVPGAEEEAARVLARFGAKKER